VFLKGCTLRCPWCCNPEAISWDPQPYYVARKCILPDPAPKRDLRSPYHERGQDGGCPNDGRNAGCKKWAAKACPTGACGVFGRWLDLHEILGEVTPDVAYYRASGGGVTLSGGEPLAHQRVADLLHALKSEGLHVAVETSLAVKKEALLATLPFVDLYLVDVKVLDPFVFREVLGGDLELYLANVELLVSRGCKVLPRAPLVRPYNFSASHGAALADFLRRFGLREVEVFSVHDLAKEKYEALGWPVPAFEVIEDEELARFAANLASSSGAAVTVLEWS